MKFALVAIPVATLRKKPSHPQELVNQLLFGEAVKIIKVKKNGWAMVRSLHDGYEGWLGITGLQEVGERIARRRQVFATTDLLSSLKIDNTIYNIPMGSSLPNFKNGTGLFGSKRYQFHGEYINRQEQVPSGQLIGQLARKWLNAPYLWGGRTPLGVDCSGFVQVVFKQVGIDLLRDAWQQAQEGEAVEKFSDIRAGDLVFFEKSKKIVHVGIMLDERRIIHASGKVRIDRLEEKGIYDIATGKLKNKLKAIRRVI